MMEAAVHRETSRLSCRIEASDAIDGLHLIAPTTARTQNFSIRAHIYSQH